MINSNLGMTLYHGTTQSFEKVDLSKSLDKRDFGRGFYTTVLLEQAMSWASNLCRRQGVSEAHIVEFRLGDYKGLKVKEFKEINEEWLELIKQNRTKGGVQHNCDIIIGPVADDNTVRTIELYLDGEITAEMAMLKLKYASPNNQVSFHNEEAIKETRMGEVF